MDSHGQYLLTVVPLFGSRATPFVFEEGRSGVWALTSPGGSEHDLECQLQDARFAVCPVRLLRRREVTQNVHALSRLRVPFSGSL